MEGRKATFSLEEEEEEGELIVVRVGGVSKVMGRVITTDVVPT